ncbi:MAG: hypothetical protein WD267_10565 [Balneolales bacterium]
MCNTKNIFLSILVSVFLLGIQNTVLAQFKADAPSSLDRTGAVTMETEPVGDDKFLGLFNFQMDHSYEMSMSSVGGNTYNQNFYTNTMHFDFNNNLYGRVDLGLAHSPFGNSMMGNDQSTQILVRNAELNYKLNDNTRFRLSFQQQPAGYGYGRGYYNRYNQGYHRSYNPFLDGW